MDLREVQQKLKEGWIQTKIIIEIAGFPEDHIDKTLNLVKDKFIKEKGIREIKTTVNKPNKISEKIFSGFIEAEFLVDTQSTIMGIIYDYMPSSIEIIAPEEIKEDTLKLSNLLNDLAAKLHMYDAAVKRLTAEQTLLARHIPDEAKEKLGLIQKKKE
jgi:hypothetical protein